MAVMSRRGRGRAAALAALTVAGTAGAIAAGPAAAAVTVPNACLYSIDGFWRNQSLNFAGAASPAAVPPGGGFALTGATAGADLPAWIPQYGYNFGILKAGENQIPTTVWVALGIGNGTGGPQVRRVSATATTTITVDGNAAFVSATPISVTVPLPDSFWSAGTTGASTIAEAAPGGLGTVTTAAGETVAPRGSVFIEATLPGGLSFRLDCQPGTAGADGTTFTPAAAAALATAAIDGSAPTSGIARSVALPAKPLRLKGRRVAVPVRCTATTTCRGIVRLFTAKRLRVGAGGAPGVVKIAQARYVVLPGRSRTLSIALTAPGRTLMANRDAVAVRVEADPARGLSTTRRLALRRAAAR